MQSVIKCLLTAACLFLFAMSANAQLVIRIKNPRDAISAYNPSFRQSLYARLLGSPVLANELKLTIEQRDALEKKREVIRNRQQELFPPPKPGATRSFPTREKQDELNKNHEKYNAEVKDHVESVLNKQQKQRMGEIQLQLLGIVAFANKDVHDDLKLSKEQIAEIESIMDACGTQIMQSMRENRGQAPGQLMLEMQAKIMNDHMVKVEDVLTGNQKNAWANKLGREFDRAKFQKEEEEDRMPRKK